MGKVVPTMTAAPLPPLNVVNVTASKPQPQENSPAAASTSSIQAYKLAILVIVGYR